MNSFAYAIFRGPVENSEGANGSMNEHVYIMLVSGAVLGLSAGLAPGPLTTLILSQTLMFGRREGMKVALAPLITDAPIVLFSIWFLGRVAAREVFLGSISLLGALVLFYYGMECIRFSGFETLSRRGSRSSLGKGIWANLFNPHPYIFWGTVGAPLITRSLAEGWGRAVSFLVGFYGSLIGAKILLATVSGLLFGRWAQIVLYLNRGLGLCLWVLGAVMAREGLEILVGMRP